MQTGVPEGFVTFRDNGSKLTIAIDRVTGFRDDPGGGTEVWMQGKITRLHIDDGHDQFSLELQRAKERAREQLLAEVKERLGVVSKFVDERLNVSVFRALTEYDPADHNKPYATTDGATATTKDGKTRLKIEQLEPSEPPKPIPAGCQSVELIQGPGRDPDELAIVATTMSLLKAIESDPAACSQLVQDKAAVCRDYVDHYIELFVDSNAARVG